MLKWYVMLQFTMISLEIEFTHNHEKGNTNCTDGNTTRCILHPASEKQKWMDKLLNRPTSATPNGR